jgi:iron complex transport system ATP-binding protein
MTESAAPRLRVEEATIGYDRRVISEALSVTIPDDSFTVIVGPNACGKSTLLRALSRLLRTQSGDVLLDGASISSYRAKEVARRLGLLPQTSIAPDGITVADLVARGRYPHQGLIRQWTDDDEAAVVEAMRATGVTELSPRLVDELLELFTDLHLAGHTLVAVLHDLNHAARFATHLIAMKGGRIVAQGPPRTILTEELVETVFGLPCRVVDDPVTGTPMVVPLGRRRDADGRRVS